MTDFRDRSRHDNEDFLLDGRVRLRQPAHGYRAAIDPGISGRGDPGRNGGGDPRPWVRRRRRVTMPCRSRRRMPPGGEFESDRELVRLGGDNVVHNGLSDRVMVLVGDLMHPPQRLRSFRQFCACNGEPALS